MADAVGQIVAAATAEPTEGALEIMRLSLLDWAACGIAGRHEPVSRIVQQMVEDEGGSEQATLIGGGRAPMRAAALLNGTTSHALDYDDTHFAHIGHPSVAVIPVALAVAEARGSSLDQMLRAALTGCEASIRFGQLLGRGHYQVGFHQTSTAGAFGATLAAALLFNADTMAIHEALALVSTRASGLKSQFGTMGKPYNAGIAASNGVEAACLASRGFLSRADAITSQNGFLGTHHADGTVDPSPGFLMENVSHKFHACCHGLHAMLEALSKADVEPDSVSNVIVETHPRWLTVCNILEPQTGLETKFSFRMAAAMALRGDDTGALATYSDAAAKDPARAALRDRVNVVANTSLSETASRVTIETQSGTEVFRHDLAEPLPLEVRQVKLRQKATSLLGDTSAEALYEATSQDDLTQLLRCLAC